MSEQRAGADLGGNPGDAGAVGDRGSTGPVLWQGRDLLQCVRTVPHVEEAALFLGTEKQAKVNALQPAGRVMVSSTTRLADCILLAGVASTHWLCKHLHPSTAALSGMSILEETSSGPAKTRMVKLLLHVPPICPYSPGIALRWLSIS